MNEIPSILLAFAFLVFKRFLELGGMDECNASTISRFCVSHQTTYNYSLSAIDYNNYIDNYDSGTKTCTKYIKIPFFIYNMG